MFKKNFSLLLLLAIILFWDFVPVVSAKPPDPAEVPPIIWKESLPWGNKEGERIEIIWEGIVDDLLEEIIPWVLGILASAAIVVIMVGGYMMLTSLGWDQTTKGKETIMYGVIGLIIVILSYAIVTIVQNFNFFIP